MDIEFLKALIQGGASAVILGFVLWRLVPAFDRLTAAIERMDARQALAEDVAKEVAISITKTAEHASIVVEKAAAQAAILITEARRG